MWNKAPERSVVVHLTIDDSGLMSGENGVDGVLLLYTVVVAVVVLVP